MSPIEHAILVLGLAFKKKHKDKELADFCKKLANFYHSIANENFTNKKLQMLNKEALKIEKKLSIIK